jgi:hypothetical protein
MRLTPSGSGNGVRLGGLGPSLGAAASLLAAGIVLSVLIAALLGASVWPDAPGRAEADTVTLPAAQPPRAAAPVPDDRAGGSSPVTGTPAPAATAARPDRPRPRARTRPAPRRTAPRPTAPAPPAATPAPVSAADPAPAATATAPQADTDRAERPRPTPTPIRGGGGGNGEPPPQQPGAVEQTVTVVREAAKPVTTALPAPVQEPVEQVLDSVQETAAGLDQTLKPVNDLTGALGGDRRP